MQLMHLRSLMYSKQQSPPSKSNSGVLQKSSHFPSPRFSSGQSKCHSVSSSSIKLLSTYKLGGKSCPSDIYKTDILNGKHKMDVSNTGSRCHRELEHEFGSNRIRHSLPLCCCIRNCKSHWMVMKGDNYLKKITHIGRIHGSCEIDSHECFLSWSS